jgi:hypothetical protein
MKSDNHASNTNQRTSAPAHSAELISVRLKPPPVTHILFCPAPMNRLYSPTIEPGDTDQICINPKEKYSTIAPDKVIPRPSFQRFTSLCHEIPHHSFHYCLNGNSSMH